MVDRGSSPFQRRSHLKVCTRLFLRLLSPVAVVLSLGSAPLALAQEVPIANLTPLYWACPSMSQACMSSSAWRLQVGAGTGVPALGYVKTVAESGTLPLYWACTTFAMNQTGCAAWGARTSPAAGPYGPLPATLLGYVLSGADGALTTPLYWACTAISPTGPNYCASYVPRTGSASAPATLLGYLYTRTTRPAL
jgi:hypothetical protein